ncbi:MAG: hypothetical protein ACD_3C00205G0023 [uncultured bacterium (gcode 4)]|uniref:Uncharacterized protein n=1 Tax=uncultured bacterium (gcode 4) TaxID=1234023 RepID=K2GVV0_9BACT|nr:MAG: hypothetical protein ACD_3C00205G0023 [uncultured bacterium (gcode 4)]
MTGRTQYWKWKKIELNLFNACHSGFNCHSGLDPESIKNNNFNNGRSQVTDSRSSLEWQKTKGMDKHLFDDKYIEH